MRNHFMNRYLLFLFLLVVIPVQAAYEVRFPAGVGHNAADEEASESSPTFDLIFNAALGSIVSIPLRGSVNVSIDWGDASANENCPRTAASEGVITCTYANSGVYTVSIDGTLSRFGPVDNNPRDRADYYLYPDSSQENLVAITSWGNVGLQSLDGAFSSAPALTVLPSSLPASLITVRGLLAGAGGFTGDISGWGLNRFSDWSYLFFNNDGAISDLTSLNTSGVTNMTGTFKYTSNFNQNINGWDVSQVQYFDEMFSYSSVFNQDLNNWVTSSATQMYAMFEGAWAFNGHISNWDVSNVYDFSMMFYEARAFNQPIGSWDMSSAEWIYAMFSETLSFNQPLNSWNTANITDFDEVFYNAYVFNQPLGMWDVSNAEYMGSMFYSANNFNQNLSCWNVLNFSADSDFAGDDAALSPANEPLWGTDGSTGTCDN